MPVTRLIDGNLIMVFVLFKGEGAFRRDIVLAETKINNLFIGFPP